MAYTILRNQLLFLEHKTLPTVLRHPNSSNPLQMAKLLTYYFTVVHVCVCVLCVVFSILWIRHQESGHINPAKSVSNTTLPRQIPLFKVTRPSYPKCLHKSTDKIASVISHRSLSIHNLSTL